jgi:tellurite resistance protein TerC
MFVDEEQAPNVADNAIIRYMAKRLPTTTTVTSQRFFVRERDDATGTMRRVATPLFFALVAIEISDLIFAVDSIPAVLAISQDPFIIYTSNIFAILNLRALYFVLDALVARCRYLKPALSAILIFIGGKIFYSMLVGHVDPLISLVVTLGLLTSGIVASLLVPPRRGPMPQPLSADTPNRTDGRY